jgi:MoaA/NifB/PqqE/SkfB family radical SAM enzyme
VQHVQTSPYLTCVRPNVPSPIIFCTDPTHTRPDTSAPHDARFGVLGLDRQVHWEADESILHVLEAAAPAPIATTELVQRYGPVPVQIARDRQWLQEPSQLCTEYYLHSGEIEVTAHCNWGCTFCPVADDPKPRETMPMDLFEHIIAKLSAQETIKYVGFQFYNEPTLDKFFADRTVVLREAGIKLALYTNASGLTAEKLRLLQDSGILLHLVVNLPSLDPNEFAELTGSATYRRSVANLDLAVEMGVRPISVAVNGIGRAREANVKRLRDRYGPHGIDVYATTLSDRAGQIEREPINEHVRITGRLTGCSWPVNHAHFSVRGDMFMCCNDYYQREKFGNVKDGSIHEIMTSPAAVSLRRRVFGVEEAPSDMICRSCHDQLPDFPERQFRPLASFPATELQASARVRHNDSRS